MASKQQFLVVDDYGTGGIWFVLHAASEDEIRMRLPASTVKVYEPGAKPDWMTDAFFEDIARRRTFDIDALPSSAWMDNLRRRDSA